MLFFETSKEKKAFVLEEECSKNAQARQETLPKQIQRRLSDVQPMFHQRWKNVGAGSGLKGHCAWNN